ncbi:MAG: DUF2911 domain-containing protein [Blastocatellia bacterium]|nr:DUF2911 domain-containing protein [Blastocatellia bacterium]
MIKNRSFKTIFALSALLTLALGAIIVQAQRQRKSPHETVEFDLNGKKVSVTYGRPSAKGRKIFGELVPFDKVWRTGADEATTLKTDADLMFGNTAVPKGEYTLWTLPSATGMKLVINKQTGQWGTVYDEKQDFARVDMKVAKLGAAVEQFTLTLTKEDKGGLLKLEWETTSASIAFTEKK